MKALLYFWMKVLSACPYSFKSSKEFPVNFLFSPNQYPAIAKALKKEMVSPTCPKEESIFSVSYPPWHKDK